MLVGPDNGLLTPAAERFGGVVEAVDIGSSPSACGRSRHLPRPRRVRAGRRGACRRRRARALGERVAPTRSSRSSCRARTATAIPDRARPHDDVYGNVRSTPRRSSRPPPACGRARRSRRVRAPARHPASSVAPSATSARRAARLRRRARHARACRQRRLGAQLLGVGRPRRRGAAARAMDGLGIARHPRVHRRVTGSTSVDARALALAGAPHGTLVTASSSATAAAARAGAGSRRRAGPAVLARAARPAGAAVARRGRRGRRARRAAARC